MPQNNAAKGPAPVGPGQPKRTAGYPHFALGVKYAEKGLAKPFGDAGVRWARARPESFAWGNIEHQAPVGTKHTYDWSCPDALVTEYQAAGMQNMQIYLSSQSSWGTNSLLDLSPKPQYTEDYRSWVKALIERYDGDGTADMPGLRAPIRYWVVGSEWSLTLGFGMSEDYLAFLALTHDAARAAWPDVQIGAVPFLLFDVFEGDEPTDDQISMRIQDPPPPWRYSTLGLRAILDRPQIFEYMNLHSIGDYSELRPMLAWLRNEMQIHGFEKPIWIDEASPIGYLVGKKSDLQIDLPTIFPVTPEIETNISSLLHDVANLEEPAYGKAMAWIQAQVAVGVIKKVVSAMAAGAIGIQMGSTEDTLDDSAPVVRQTQVDLLGTAAMTGLIDVHHDSFLPCVARQPASARPAVGNLSLLYQKLGADIDGNMTQLELEATKSVRLFRYTRAGQTLWIAWNDDHLLHLPDEGELSVMVDLPAHGTRMRVTHTLTATGTPETEEMSVNSDGTVTVPLTSVPVFLESVR